MKKFSIVVLIIMLSLTGCGKKENVSYTSVKEGIVSAANKYLVDVEQEESTDQEIVKEGIVSASIKYLTQTEKKENTNDKISKANIFSTAKKCLAEIKKEENIDYKNILSVTNKYLKQISKILKTINE